MGDWVACLRGWHPSLAKAELQALLPGAHLSETGTDRWWRVRGVDETSGREALHVASGLQCFLVDGVVMPTGDTNPEAWVETVRAYLDQHHVAGSIAVRAWKQGGKIPGWSLSALSRRLGGVLSDRGCTVDLEQPDHVLAIIADGPASMLACGWMVGDGQAAFSNGERRAGERPFFKPVSLDPTLARLAVNLAAGPVSNGPVVDPMTGTGGFLIEAALSGRPALGIDLHSEMVHGAQANLNWACDGPPDHARVVRGDATRMGDVVPEDWIGHVAGFVLDPPYGRNSHGSLEPHALLAASLQSARRVAAQDAGFVLILPIHPLEPHPTTELSVEQTMPLLRGSWDEVKAVVSEAGWQLVSGHVERVHRSLSRLILHARCAPQG
jgi:tRNA (guanine10-N2)-dimethyltransferase